MCVDHDSVLVQQNVVLIHAASGAQNTASSAQETDSRAPAVKTENNTLSRDNALCMLTVTKLCYVLSVT